MHKYLLWLRHSRLQAYELAEEHVSGLRGLALDVSACAVPRILANLTGSLLGIHYRPAKGFKVGLSEEESIGNRR
jgi:hypothetical protein